MANRRFEMKGVIAVLLFISLTISNFVYQFTTGEPNWISAAERSYFQGAALLCYWLTLRFIVK